MTVKLIRMWSGEDVIADIVEETTDSIVITDPIVAVPSQQQGQIGFAPWSPLPVSYTHLTLPTSVTV